MIDCGVGQILLDAGLNDLERRGLTRDQGAVGEQFDLDIAPENDEAAIWLATLATATAGVMPIKMSSGVINMPEMNPTASPIPSTRKLLTGRSAIGS